MKRLAILMGVISLVCRGDEWLDEIKAEYDFESWAGTTNAFYTTTVPTIDILSLNLPTNDLRASYTYFHNDDFRFQELMVFWGDGHNLLEISARVAPSVLEAQTALIGNFSNFSVSPLPWVTNGLAGDRCYCKYVDSDWGYVAFARNNVFAEVMSYTNTISAFEIAVQLDSAILDASTNVQQRSGMKSDKTLRSRVSSFFRKLFSPNSSKDEK